MPYVNIPKDMSKVKSKLAFNMTGRQLISVGLIAVTAIPAFLLTKDALGSTGAGLLAFLVGVPIFLTGNYEKDGQPFEKVLKNALNTFFLRKKKRPFESENYYTYLLKQADLDEEIKAIKNEVNNAKKGKSKFTAVKLEKNKEKRINEAISKARPKGSAKKPENAQQSIPIQQMFKDGTCRVTDKLYNKTLQFFDINYQLSNNEVKTYIFEHWCSFINYFDPSISVQLSFLNMNVDVEEFSRQIEIEERTDDFNSIRREYVEMLRNQLAKGNNGLIKSKYITFGIEGDSYKDVKQRLERIQEDIINNFKIIGVSAFPLNGTERLAVLHSSFNPTSGGMFNFDWNTLSKSGMSVKDVIAPSSFEFNLGNGFKMDDKFGAVSFLNILCSELEDRMLADFLAIESSITISMHIRSIDHTKAVKWAKRKKSDIDKMKMDYQIRASRGGYDSDIIPPDILTYSEEALEFLKDLQSRNERLFMVTFIIMNIADKKRTLENIIFQEQGIAQKYNCQLKRLSFQQENGLFSTVPLGLDLIKTERSLTTSSTAIFVPFTTHELFQQGEALYYGINALSNNMIMADRKQLKNPNGMILGTPGSGKSFSAKREIVNVFLVTQDDIAICDPEAEYYPLVSRLGGQVIKISPTSTQYINPLDINIDYSDDESPISLKSDFILSLCELIVGNKGGLEPIEKTIIDRCVAIMYRPFLADPENTPMPILEDLYNIILEQPESEAKRIATALEMYVKGSLKVFNNRTNVDISNRIVCFDIKELGKQLKKIGMLVVQDAVWNRVTVNRAAKKSTRYYIDEFHLLLKDEQTANYSIEIWKRFRKWGGIPTGITQNVKDFLASKDIEVIFENSDFIYLLNQAPDDRRIIAERLNISPQQIKYVENAAAGEGIICYGNTIIPFIDRFPKDTELYRIMTTKLEET